MVDCRKCGIEIKPGETSDLCDGCSEEKFKDLIADNITDIEKRFDVTIWAEWVNNKDKEPKKVYKNY